MFLCKEKKVNIINLNKYIVKFRDWTVGEK